MFAYTFLSFALHQFSFYLSRHNMPKFSWLFHALFAYLFSCARLYCNQCVHFFYLYLCVYPISILLNRQKLKITEKKAKTRIFSSLRKEKKLFMRFRPIEFIFGISIWLCLSHTLFCLSFQFNRSHITGANRKLIWSFCLTYKMWQ